MIATVIRMAVFWIKDIHIKKLNKELTIISNGNLLKSIKKLTKQDKLDISNGVYRHIFLDKLINRGIFSKNKLVYW